MAVQLCQPVDPNASLETQALEHSEAATRWDHELREEKMGVGEVAVEGQRKNSSEEIDETAAAIVMSTEGSPVQVEAENMAAVDQLGGSPTSNPGVAGKVTVDLAVMETAHEAGHR